MCGSGAKFLTDEFFTCVTRLHGTVQMLLQIAVLFTWVHIYFWFGQKRTRFRGFRVNERRNRASFCSFQNLFKICKRDLVVQNTCNTNHSGVFFLSPALESTTAILKIVGIVLGALSAFCALVAGCCKYCCNSNNSRDDPVVQDSENINQIPGFNNYTSQEQVATTKM